MEERRRLGHRHDLGGIRDGSDARGRDEGGDGGIHLHVQRLDARIDGGDRRSDLHGAVHLVGELLHDHVCLARRFFLLRRGLRRDTGCTVGVRLRRGQQDLHVHRVGCRNRSRHGRRHLHGAVQLRPGGGQDWCGQLLPDAGSGVRGGGGRGRHHVAGGLLRERDPGSAGQVRGERADGGLRGLHVHDGRGDGGVDGDEDPGVPVAEGQQDHVQGRDDLFGEGEDAGAELQRSDAGGDDADARQPGLCLGVHAEQQQRRHRDRRHDDQRESGGRLCVRRMPVFELSVGARDGNGDERDQR